MATLHSGQAISMPTRMRDASEMSARATWSSSKSNASCAFCPGNDKLRCHGEGNRMRRKMSRTTLDHGPQQTNPPNTLVCPPLLSLPRPSFPSRPPGWHAPSNAPLPHGRALAARAARARSAPDRIGVLRALVRSNSGCTSCGRCGPLNSGAAWPNRLQRMDDT